MFLVCFWYVFGMFVVCFWYVLVCFWYVFDMFLVLTSFADFDAKPHHEWQVSFLRSWLEHNYHHVFEMCAHRFWMRPHSRRHSWRFFSTLVFLSCAGALYQEPLCTSHTLCRVYLHSVVGSFALLAEKPFLFLATGAGSLGTDHDTRGFVGKVRPVSANRLPSRHP